LDPTRLAATVTLPPDGVNLIALINRFHTICCNRSGSATSDELGASERSFEICARANLLGHHVRARHHVLDQASRIEQRRVAEARLDVADRELRELLAALDRHTGRVDRSARAA